MQVRYQAAPHPDRKLMLPRPGSAVGVRIIPKPAGFEKPYVRAARTGLKSNLSAARRAVSPSLSESMQRTQLAVCQ